MNDPDKDRFAVLPGFADRQIHREGCPVLAETDDFPADADDLGFGASQEIPDIVVVMQTICLRHQHFDVFVEDLAGAVSESLSQAGLNSRMRPRASIKMKPSTAVSTTAVRRAMLSRRACWV